MSLKIFYSSAFWRSLAESLIGPFMPLFALSLGATKTLIGLLSSLPIFSSLFSQSFFGSVAENVRRKRFLIVAGGILWAIFWIPIAYVKEPIQLIVLVTLQSLFSSISIPAWTVLLIQLTPSYKRGTVTGYLSIFDATGSFFGTLLGGYILNQFGFIPFFFYIIFFLGIMCRLQFFSIKEPMIPVYRDSLKEIVKRTFNFSELKKDKRLATLTGAMVFLNFAVSIAGPFFSIYVVEKLGGTKMDVAIISAIGVVSAIIFFKAWGTLIDYIGKKAIMISCLIPISFIPLVYAVTNSIYWLYIYTIISNISWAGFNMASFSYLSDIVPRERISSNIATYNLLTGLSSATAPFIGGIIADSTSIWFVFLISTVLRFFSSYIFDKLEERTGFKPKGFFKFEFEPFGISYRIENFVSTYSLVIQELGTDFGKYLNRFKKNYFRKK